MNRTEKLVCLKNLNLFDLKTLDTAFRFECVSTELNSIKASFCRELKKLRPLMGAKTKILGESRNEKIILAIFE